MQAANLRAMDEVLKNAFPRIEEYPGFGNLVSTVLLQVETTAGETADMRAEIQQLRKEMSAKDDQMKTMENSYTDCMKALKDKEEADKKEKETWKKELEKKLEEKLGIVQKEWEEKSERNGIALQEQYKEANEKLQKMEEQLMMMMEELKVTKEQHEKEKKKMEGQMNKMTEAMEQKMKAERDRTDRDQAERNRAEKDRAEKDQAKKYQDEKDWSKKYQDEKDWAKKYRDEKDQAKKYQDEKDQAKKYQDEKDRAKKDQDEKAKDEKMMTESDLQKQKFALSYLQMKDLEPGALAWWREERSEETLQPVKLQPQHVEAMADLLNTKISFRSCPCCELGVSQTKAINTSEIFDLLCPSCYSLMKKLSSAEIMEASKFCPWCGHTSTRKRPTKTVAIPDLLCSDCRTLMEKLHSSRTMDISDLPCSACPLLQPFPGQEIKMTTKPPSVLKPTIMEERVSRIHFAKKLATGRETAAQKIYKTTTLDSPPIITPLKAKPTIITPMMPNPLITSKKTNLQPLSQRKTTTPVTPTPMNLRKRSRISLKKGNTNPVTRR